MTTVFTAYGNKRPRALAGTHVLIIGVGEYPCLIGGDRERLIEKPMGLSQLSSPPRSAVALADWFVGRQGGAQQDVEQTGFYNPDAPLATVELLVSPCTRFRCPHPSASEIEVEVATRRNIARRYRDWIKRAKSKPGNIAVFYFCGHGAAGSNDYVFPSDFGKNTPDNPWADAIDITETARATRREVCGSLYFFIDACRQVSRDSVMPGSGTPALKFVDFSKKVVCLNHMLLWSTGEGAAAFGAPNRVSRFTSALVSALSGFYGEELPDAPTSWVVTGQGLAMSVDAILKTENSSLDDALHQHIEQQLIGSKAFHYETRAPKTIGRVVPMWSANPSVRELAHLQDANLGMAAQEALAEQLEQRNVQFDELRREIEEWIRLYRELEQRLADERDSELVQQAKNHLTAGKLDEARELLDDLITRTETRLAADRVRLASYYLSRAEVYALQFKLVEALPSFREAYELYPFEPKYSLPYAFALEELNDHKRAEPICTSALSVLRTRADTTPDDLRHVAGTLNNLGMLYHKTDRLPEAERAYEEALGTYRKLAGADSPIYCHEVATTLNNLGVLYRDTNRLVEAENALKEALAIRWELADANPSAYRPNVATTLHNLGVLYRKAKRWADAETEYRKALDIRRELSKTNPVAYLPSVAATLNNIGVLYRDTNILPKAETAFREALDILRALAEGNPSAYQPNLAKTLNNLGTLYRDTKRQSEAEAALGEALDLRRNLADASPAAYLPKLADTLHNVGVLYLRADCLKAETALEEALSIRRKLADANPSVYLPELADTLHNVGVLYLDKARFKAEAVLLEALAIYRRLNYLPQLAALLHNVGLLYCDSSRPAEAETALGEALIIYRKLAEVNLSAYFPKVADMFRHLGAVYRDTERIDGAKLAEALDSYRKLAEVNSSAYEADVKLTLNKLAALERDNERPA